MSTKIFGYVERVTEKSIKGWAAKKETPSKPIKLRVKVGDRILATSETSEMRPDVMKVLSLDSEHHGFFIEVQLNADEIATVRIEAQDGKKWVPIQRFNPSIKQGGGYQDFDGSGGSKSHEKLKALKLYDIVKGQDMVTPLKGKSVLDIGCNEGFFCVEAVKQGASRVVGIDFSEKFINLAKQRCPEAEFHKATWWELPDERFDVIFFLSAIHYEPRQQELLTKLLNHLTPDCVLILECGVSPKNGIQESWMTIARWDADRRYPDIAFLQNILLKGYSSRIVGHSVMQDGDPIPRVVLHCRSKKPTAILVGGYSHAGKTSIAGTLRNAELSLYQTDITINRLMSDTNIASKPLAKLLQAIFANRPALNYAEIGNYIVENGHLNEFLTFLMSELPMEADNFIVEGEILRHDEVMAALSERLKEVGVRAWSLIRTA